MKNISFLFIINFILLYGQNLDNIKGQIKNAGLTIDQAKQVASQKGFDNQGFIDKNIDTSLPTEIPSDDTKENINEEFDEIINRAQHYIDFAKKYKQ